VQIIVIASILDIPMLARLPLSLAVSELSAEQHEAITRRGITITNLSIGGARVP